MPVKQMLGENLPKSDLEKIFKETQPGQVRVGVVGTPEAPLYNKDEKPSELTPEEEVEARVLKALLLKWIAPPRLSEKSKVEDDKRSFTRKVNGQTLPDLRRFFNIELSDEIVDALRRKYNDISP